MKKSEKKEDRHVWEIGKGIVVIAQLHVSIFDVGVADLPDRVIQGEVGLCAHPFQHAVGGLDVCLCSGYDIENLGLQACVIVGGDAGFGVGLEFCWEVLQRVP